MHTLRKAGPACWAAEKTALHQRQELRATTTSLESSKLHKVKPHVSPGPF